jgi:transposase-like protein
MNTIIIIIIVIAAISVTIYFSLKKKIVCPNCRSDKVILTGEKKYKEDPPFAFWGSPDSYYEYEYRCENCNQVFWKKQKTVIIN